MKKLIIVLALLMIQPFALSAANGTILDKIEKDLDERGYIAPRI